MDLSWHNGMVCLQKAKPVPSHYSAFCSSNCAGTDKVNIAPSKQKARPNISMPLVVLCVASLSQPMIDAGPRKPAEIAEAN